MRDKQDEIVEAIRFSVRPEPDGLLTTDINGPQDALVVQQVVGAFDGWRELKINAPFVLQRTGGAARECRFIFKDDDTLDEDEKDFEGVLLINAWREEAVVSQSAFEQLMARFFRAVIEGTPKNRPQDLRDPFWPEFVRITEELERRVRAQDANGATDG